MAADALHVHPDLHAAPVAPVDAAVGGLRGHHELRGDAVLVVDVLPAQGEQDPYQGYETEDIIYGRGGSDQEGGVVSAVYGAKIMKGNRASS